MNKLLRISLIVIGLIVAVIIAGYFTIKTFLTPDTIQNIAEKAISESIHRPVEIGKVGLRIGLKVGITIDDISLSNVRGFSSGQMMQIDKTTLNLKLLPLLRRQIVIAGVDLSGVKINVERNKKGRLNIPTIPSKKGKGSGWSLSLSSISISKGDIRYVDAKSKTEIQIKDIRQNIQFKGSKIYFSGENTIYTLKGKNVPEMVIQTKNNIEYDTLKKNVYVKKLTALYEPIYLEVSGTIEKMEMLGLAANLKIDDMSKLKSLIPIESRPNKLRGVLKTDFSVLGTLKKPRLDGSCELKNVTIIPKGMIRGVEKIQGSLSFDQKSIRNIIIKGEIGKAKLDVSGSITNLQDPILNIIAKIDGNLKDIESITNEMKDIKMKGPVFVCMTVKGKMKNPSFFGEYNVRNAYINGIGLAKPITNFNIKGTIHGDAARIDKCSGDIGRSDFSFNGHISNFKQPVIQINNKSKTIDLDELIPKSEGHNKEKAKPVPITIQGKTRINTLTGLDMVFKNVNTNFTYENGIIDIRNCIADAFDGKVKFDFYYNANNPEPYSITTNMTSISSKKILKRFLKFENLEGRLTGVSNFDGRGLSQKEVISNLTASGNLTVKNGAFKNFEFITKLLSWLGMKNYKTVKLNELAVYFTIDKGKVNVKDWALSSSVGNFLLNGTIGLTGNLKLDITTTLTKKYSNIVKNYHGEWIFPIDKKGRATIDIIVSGTLTNPKFSLDKNKIKKRIKGTIKNEFEKKKKGWEKKLKELLKGK
ncbi:AsmA family protein [candidate division WOR-3 bacterium]|nr:AsmA family protein [candidate division WOR-3 bacterium]